MSLSRAVVALLTARLLIAAAPEPTPPAAPGKPAPPAHRQFDQAVGTGSDAGRLSLSGRRVAVQQRETVRVYDVDSGVVVASVVYKSLFDSIFVRDLAISADDDELYLLLNDDLVVYDLAAGKRLRSMPAPAARRLSQSADGRWIAVDGEVLDARTLVRAVSTRGARVVFHPSGNMLYASGGGAGKTIQVWELRDGSFALEEKLERRHQGEFAFDPATSRIAEVGDRGVEIWSPKVKGPGLVVPAQSPHRLAFSLDGEYLGIAAFGGILVHVPSGEVVGKTGYNGWAVPFADFSVNGAAFVTLSLDHVDVFTLPRGVPYLELSVGLDDKATGGSGKLEAGESAFLVLKVANSGKGSAFGATVRMATDSSTVSLPETASIGAIRAAGSAEVRVPIVAAADAVDATVHVTLETKEINGYDASPARVGLEVRRVEAAALEITGEPRLSPSELRSGQSADIALSVQNLGGSTAYGVVLRGTCGKAVSPKGLDVPVGDLASGAAREVRFPLSIPAYYPNDAIHCRLEARDRQGAVLPASREITLSYRHALPRLRFESTVHDGDTPDSVGNRNGVPELGEVIDLTLGVTNDGEVGATDVRVQATADRAEAAFTRNSAAFGAIAPGTTTEPRSILFTLPRSFPAGPLVLTLAVAAGDLPPQLVRIEVQIGGAKVRELELGKP